MESQMFKMAAVFRFEPQPSPIDNITHPRRKERRYVLLHKFGVNISPFLRARILWGITP